mgnify:CR=1 FL=1
MVGLPEMLTRYVILSRIKTADSFLLLRRFSMRLFQQGDPPGPNCLLRFLRSRFNTLTGKLQVGESTAGPPCDGCRLRAPLVVDRAGPVGLVVVTLAMFATVQGALGPDQEVHQ